MPIYEYRCAECGVRYEKLVFNMSAPPPVCPSCSSDKVEKLISAPGACGASDGGGASAGFSGGGCGGGSGFG